MILHPGGCLCGAIRFEAAGTPLRQGYCHCHFCQRHTGAPVAASADFRYGTGFRWLKGKPATYRSSPLLRRLFCRRCGTPLAHEVDRHPGEIHVNIGAFDEPGALRPRAHFHTAQKVAWFDTADDLPRHEDGGPPEA